MNADEYNNLTNSCKKTTETILDFDKQLLELNTFLEDH